MKPKTVRLIDLTSHDTYVDSITLSPQKAGVFLARVLHEFMEKGNEHHCEPSFAIASAMVCEDQQTKTETYLMNIQITRCDRTDHLKIEYIKPQP
jgi:hypothetical protein